MRRLGYAAYAHADYTGPAVSFPSEDLRRTTVREAILAVLREPCTVRTVAERIGRPATQVRWHLVAMRRDGLVARPERATYAPAGYTGSSHRNSVQEAILAVMTEACWGRLIGERTIDQLGRSAPVFPRC